MKWIYPWNIWLVLKAFELGELTMIVFPKFIIEKAGSFFFLIGSLVVYFIIFNPIFCLCQQISGRTDLIPLERDPFTCSIFIHQADACIKRDARFLRFQVLILSAFLVPRALVGFRLLIKRFFSCHRLGKSWMSIMLCESLKVASYGFQRSQRTGSR